MSRTDDCPKVQRGGEPARRTQPRSAGSQRGFCAGRFGKRSHPGSVIGRVASEQHSFALGDRAVICPDAVAYRVSAPRFRLVRRNAKSLWIIDGRTRSAEWGGGEIHLGQTRCSSWPMHLSSTTLHFAAAARL